MTEQQERESREAFEAHMRKLNPCVRLMRQREVLGGHYRTTTVQRAWELWQAARSQQQGWRPIEREKFSQLERYLLDTIAEGTVNEMIVAKVALSLLQFAISYQQGPCAMPSKEEIAAEIMRFLRGRANPAVVLQAAEDILSSEGVGAPPALSEQAPDALGASKPTLGASADADRAAGPSDPIPSVSATGGIPSADNT